MSQFDVFTNPGTARDRAPYIVDVQSDLLDLSMRVVVPLITPEYFRARMTRLNPLLEVDNQSFVFSPTEIAGIAARRLEQRITNLAVYRGRIVAALDMIITGI